MEAVIQLSPDDRLAAVEETLAILVGKHFGREPLLAYARHERAAAELILSPPAGVAILPSARAAEVAVAAPRRLAMALLYERAATYSSGPNSEDAELAHRAPTPADVTPETKTVDLGALRQAREPDQPANE